jgi:hypothetical protein
MTSVPPRQSGWQWHVRSGEVDAVAEAFVMDSVLGAGVILRTALGQFAVHYQSARRADQPVICDELRDAQVLLHQARVDAQQRVQVERQHRVWAEDAWEHLTGRYADPAHRLCRALTLANLQALYRGTGGHYFDPETLDYYGSTGGMMAAPGLYVERQTAAPEGMAQWVLVAFVWWDDDDRTQRRRLAETLGRYETLPDALAVSRMVHAIRQTAQWAARRVGG